MVDASRAMTGAAAEPVAARPTAARDERVRRINPWRTRLIRPELGVIAGTLVVFAIFLAAAGGKGMFTPFGIINFLEVSAQLGIIACAAAMLMIGGEFDLSIGSMIAFAGILVAVPATLWGVPLWICILAAFAIAAAIGAANGAIVVRTGLHSFIVTLAALFILRGVTLAATRSITGRTQIPGVARAAEGDWLAPLFNGYVFEGFFVFLAELGWGTLRPDGSPLVRGLPVSVLWWLGLTAFATWILLRTRFGNWVFAVGGDKVAARNVGVPVGRVKIILFMGTAMAATLFAVIQVLTAGSADTLRGMLKEFEAIIAVVIGGTLLTGGYGSPIGAAFGALIFGTVQIGIFYTGLDTDWFKVFLGVMVLIAVLVNNFVRRRLVETRR